ncbi:MAG TPA: hypothetical protein PLD95_03085 [bacterium]|jgi:uncharacterized membrane protein YcjF (UPF0283 family)|nr:hypothetical protein [bacterium]HOG38432.1 hypothetical protein [bacterium]HQI03306.1 hypothetical protein [bacterium]
MKNILYGILVLACGFLVVWKAKWIVDNFGRNAWAEEKLGTSGGTVFLYKVIGILVVFFGMLMITGLKNDFLMATLGKMFFLN